MREFSNEDLIHLLVNKVQEAKESKCKAEELNKQLQETVSTLENAQKELVIQKEQLQDVNGRLQDAVSKLEETQQELVMQKEQLEQEIEIKTKELLKTEKLATIGELSARIAHDLRNPLSVIKNTVEVVKIQLEHHFDDKTHEQWKRLDRGIFRMQHQLEDVLDYLRDAPLKKIHTNVSTIVNDAIDRISIPDNINLILPKNEHPIFCDPQKIEVVFVNLIMNSIQALAQKDGKIEILVYDEPKNDHIIIDVKDSGPGIPDDLCDKIFDPLFTTRQVGTGLGLPSCKNIIEKHGGMIDFETKVGFGTTFKIKIPKNSEWQRIDGKKTSPNQKTPFPKAP